MKVMMSDDEGREVILRSSDPTSFSGDGLIDDHPRSASVVALEACECSVSRSADFKKSLAENFEMAMTVMRGLVKTASRSRPEDRSLALMDVYGLEWRACCSKWLKP